MAPPPDADNFDILDGALVVPVPRAAKALGVSRAQIYVMLREGEIISVKFGKRRRIEVREIRRVIPAHRVG